MASSKVGRVFACLVMCSIPGIMIQAQEFAAKVKSFTGNGQTGTVIAWDTFRVDLICEVEGNPRPNITMSSLWDEVRITSPSANVYRATTLYWIHGCEGVILTCEAGNELGDDKKSLDLNCKYHVASVVSQ